MGDICDMHDLDRLMRSPEGKNHLNGIRQMLEGRTIIKVTFSNEVHAVGVLLELDDGGTWMAFEPDLEVDALRVQFEDAIEREYYKDYPERRSDENSP